jgi:hypothetical protein
MMTKERWSKWRNLNADQKIIWIKAAWCLVMIKIGLKLLPFDQFRKIFKWLTESKKKKSEDKEKVLATCWAIRSAAYHLPLSLQCLPQALSSKYLLRHETDLKVQIGVLINSPGDFEAHAWVEWKEEVVLGELPDKNYQPIWIWD